MSVTHAFGICKTPTIIGDKELSFEQITNIQDKYLDNQGYSDEEINEMTDEEYNLVSKLYSKHDLPYGNRDNLLGGYCRKNSSHFGITCIDSPGSNNLHLVDFEKLKFFENINIENVNINTLTTILNNSMDENIEELKGERFTQILSDFQHSLQLFNSTEYKGIKERYENAKLTLKEGEQLWFYFLSMF